MTTKKWAIKNDRRAKSRCVVCGQSLPKEKEKEVPLCPICEERISKERFGVE